ncbi:unnamed protein product [Urochloa humidicola]
MAPGWKRGPMKSPHLPTAPPTGATEDDARAHGHAHPTGREHMESTAGGRPLVKRPHPNGATEDGVRAHGHAHPTSREQMESAAGG